MSRRGFDWRREFEKQHGYRPGVSSAIAASAVDPRSVKAREIPSESNQGKAGSTALEAAPDGVSSRPAGGRTPDVPAVDAPASAAGLVSSAPLPTPDGVDETGLCIRTERGWAPPRRTDAAGAADPEMVALRRCPMSALRIMSIEEEPAEGGWQPGADVPAPHPDLLPFHPLANLFPLIEGKAFDDLVADVRKNGLRERIIILDGQLLDGRNRYRAAIAAGVFADTLDPRSGPYFANLPKGVDPVAYVLSKNLSRRHLTESQRAMIAAKLATLGVGRPAEALAGGGEETPAPPIGGISTAAAAKALNVGERSIERAKTVREHGAPDLVAAVERGDAAVAAAEAIARLPQARQEEILAQVAASPEGKRAFAKVAKEAHRERQETKKTARAVREEILGRRIQKMPDGAVGIILEDFEWDFETWSPETGRDRHASNHYTTADDAHTAEEIVARRPLPPGAAKDLIVFSWTTVPHLGIAMDVLKLRGLRYVSHFAWLKSRIITGYWNRGKHELLLISTRGQPVAPGMLDEKLPSWLDALAGLAMEAEAERRTHSAKPEIFAEWIERLWPNTPKIELNRVGPSRAGWLAWGNQAEVEDAAAPRVVGRDRHIEILRDIARGHRSGMHDPADPDVAALVEAGEISVSKGHRGRILAPGIAKLEELDGAAAEEGAAAAEPKKPRAKKAPKKNEWEMRRERIASRAEAILAATRGDLDEMIADYRETLAAGHTAAMAGDDEAWRACCERREALVLAANGGDHVGAAVNERPTALLSACRAEPGVAPLWGQAGVFRLEVDGVPVLVDVGSRWGSGIDVGLHAVSFAHKFPSETGYRSIPSLSPAEGTTIDEAVAIGFRRLLQERPSEGLPPGPYYPENVYAPAPDGRLMFRRRGISVDPESPPAGYDWPAIFALFEVWRDSWGRGRPKAGERRFPKSAHHGTLIVAIDGAELRPVAEFPTSGVYVFDRQGVPANRYRLVLDGANPEGPAE